MCFGGKVDDITNFWDKNVKDSFSKQVNYDMSITEPQYCPMVRNDWEQLLPCCGSDQYYEDSSMGISLNKQEGRCNSPDGCGTPDKYECGQPPPPPPPKEEEEEVEEKEDEVIGGGGTPTNNEGSKPTSNGGGKDDFNGDDSGEYFNDGGSEGDNFG